MRREDASLRRGNTLVAGKGALGKRRASKGNTVRARLDREAVPTSRDVELRIRPFMQGAYAGKRLSFGLNGKGSWGNAIAANRTWEIRPSGMRGGLTETWVMEEIGTRCTNRKGACRTLSSWGCARRISTRQPAVRNFREDAGNVGHGRIRHPLHISKEWMTETLCLQPGAPVFYPTPISANVCKGGLTCLSKS
jgi:hypothetical protein